MHYKTILDFRLWLSESSGDSDIKVRKGEFPPEMKLISRIKELRKCYSFYLAVYSFETR